MLTFTCFYPSFFIEPVYLSNKGKVIVWDHLFYQKASIFGIGVVLDGGSIGSTEVPNGRASILVELP